jgi:voltage-gated potassium channel Kch
MDDDPSWPALMAGYKEALEGFERCARTLTAALLDRNTSPEALSARFAAEATARDAVVLTRTRIMNLWRDSQPPFGLPVLQADDKARPN